jgi:hypothetical protein
MAGFEGGLQAGAMVEGQQHVIDRRAIGHDRGLASTEESSGLPSSHETGLVSTPRGVRRVGPERSEWCDLGPESSGWRVENAHNIKSGNPEVDWDENSWFSRLKWLNSPYRPALPEGIRAAIVPPLSRQVIGASPSGKAVDFDSTMRRFESSRPSQAFLRFPRLPEETRE